MLKSSEPRWGGCRCGLWAGLSLDVWRVALWNWSLKMTFELPQKSTQGCAEVVTRCLYLLGHRARTSEPQRGARRANYLSRLKWRNESLRGLGTFMGTWRLKSFPPWEGRMLHIIVLWIFLSLTSSREACILPVCVGVFPSTTASFRATQHVEVYLCGVFLEVEGLGPQTTTLFSLVSRQEGQP